MFSFNYVPPTQPQPSYINPSYSSPRSMGRWVMAKDYNEIQSTPLPIDGSQIIFMLESEPTFYVVSMVGGQKMVQGYQFTAMSSSVPTQMQSTSQNSSSQNNLSNDINNSRSNINYQPNANVQEQQTTNKSSVQSQNQQNSQLNMQPNDYFESRINRIEGALSKLLNLVEGSVTEDESNISNGSKTQATK